MKNQTIDIIHSHRSIRAYTADPVPDEMIKAIVAAGQRASTSSNMQLTTAVVVRDEARKHKLSMLCGDQDQIRQAPVFIAWCTDRYRLDVACAQQGYTQDTSSLETFLVAAVDVGIFMQTATIAAESLGLGMCYIGGIRNNPAQVIELLGLPQHVFPISGMALGWPNADPIHRPRLPLEAVLHWESYDTEKLLPDLQSYDKVMAETGIYGGRQVQLADGSTEMENYGWMEHTARRIVDAPRKGMRAVVESQGFGLK